MMSSGKLVSTIIGGTLAVAAGEVTFNKDIAPVVLEQCAGCHRPGEAAPFSLLGYEDVAKRAKLVRDVVEERFMPPWHAERGHGVFKDARVLDDEQVALFSKWIEAGKPEGAVGDLPKKPDFPNGWQLGEPDLVLEMPEAYEVRADGRDIYRYFALPADLPEDKWVTAVEVRPSARSVVHHVLFFLDDKGKAREMDAADTSAVGFRGRGFRGTGDLGGWAVGTTPQHFPDGLALPMSKGSDLVIQTHFHPTGKVEKEQTKIGLYFADKAPEKKLVSFQVPPMYGAFAGIDIPPGAAKYVVEDSFVVPVDMDLINVWGHSHQTCRSIEGTMTLPDGTVKPVLNLPEWDFNWQTIYQYQKPERVPAGTRIDVKIVFDNSADNPNNPNDPPKRIKWGEQSTDEMGSLIFQAVAAEESELPQFVSAEREQQAWGRAMAGVRWVGKEKFIGALGLIKVADANGDGKVTKDELKADWAGIAFGLLDRDKDGAIGKAEVELGEEVAAKVFKDRSAG